MNKSCHYCIHWYMRSEIIKQEETQHIQELITSLQEDNALKSILKQRLAEIEYYSDCTLNPTWIKVTKFHYCGSYKQRET